MRNDEITLTYNTFNRVILHHLVFMLYDGICVGLTCTMTMEVHYLTNNLLICKSRLSFFHFCARHVDYHDGTDHADTMTTLYG